LGGSGLELLAQLQNQQDSATRASARDTDVAAQAQQRALDALIQGGTVAGNIRNQDFNEAAQRANAQDAAARFNAQKQQAANLANTQARNAAQAANVGMSQDIANQNVATRNAQNAQRAQVTQQRFNNEMAKRGGQSGVAVTNAQAAGDNSRNRANAANQSIGTGLSAASVFAQGMSSQPRTTRPAQQITTAGEAYTNPDIAYAKNGGLVQGPPSNHDSQPYMLQPGELIVRKEDVPEVLKKTYTRENGDFDAAGFLDAITGQKYGFRKDED
jgi:hypothetical protein